MRFLQTVALALLAVATAVQSAYIQHDALDQVPHGWSIDSSVDTDNIHINYRIAIKQNESGVKQLQEYLLEHSANPHSPNYGKHLHHKVINQMVAPSKHSVQNVVNWLNKHGITDLVHTDGSDFISFTAPVSTGNKLFNTQYNVYQHQSGERVLRTQAYSLPQHIVDHVDFISPSTRFPHINKHTGSNAKLYSVDKHGKFHAMGKAPTQNTAASNKPVAGAKGGKPVVANASPATTAAPYTGPSATTGNTTDYGNTDCSEITTFECIKQLYNFTNYVPQAPNSNSIGILGYLGQYYNYDNLQLSLSTFGVPMYGSNVIGTQPSITGDDQELQQQKNEAEAGIEADLDVQTIENLVYPTPATFYSIAGLQPYTDSNTNAGPLYGENEPYAHWLSFVLNKADVPPVISTSYSDNENTVSYTYAQRVCTEFMELGAQGVSLIFGSGDGGVAGAQTAPCYTTADGTMDGYVPNFPSTCPWITTTGATQIGSDGTESASSAFYSGGGFSWYFDQPSYQSKLVNQFLTTVDPSIASLYNPTGRAYPDVAAIGVNFPIYINGGQLAGATGVSDPTGVTSTVTSTAGVPVLFTVDGTSASTPTFASIVTLLNDARIAAGKTPVGFLNPAIYAAPHIFHDIVSGSNPGCGSAGFSAVAGWDAVTGLGSPSFNTMLPYFMSLGDVTPVYSTPFPDSAFNGTTGQPNYPEYGNPILTAAPSTTGISTTSPATTAPVTTPIPTAAQGAKYVCAPNFQLIGVSGTPNISVGTAGVAVTLVTVNNPGVALSGLTGCCLYGSTPNCAVQ